MSSHATDLGLCQIVFFFFRPDQRRAFTRDALKNFISFFLNSAHHYSTASAVAAAGSAAARWRPWFYSLSYHSSYDCTTTNDPWLIGLTSRHSVVTTSIRSIDCARPACYYLVSIINWAFVRCTELHLPLSTLTRSDQSFDEHRTRAAEQQCFLICYSAGRRGGRRCFTISRVCARLSRAVALPKETRGLFEGCFKMILRQLVKIKY